jgi:hypothetical protein
MVDRHPVLGEHPADRLDPETVPIDLDVDDDHRSRRSSSAAAKNAEAVFNISLARFSSAFSFRNACNSADASLVIPGRAPASISVLSTQPRVGRGRNVE